MKENEAPETDARPDDRQTNGQKTEDEIRALLQRRADSGHGFPLTRRDFLSSGIQVLAAFALLPKWNLTGLLGRLGGGVTTMPAFLVFDLAGGASMPANFLVGGRGGPEDLLPSYSYLGWNPRTTEIDTRFGLPMAGGDVSRMRAGMLSVLSAEAQARLRMGSFCHFSFDDTASNTTSSVVEAARFVHLQNANLPKGLALRGTASGGNTGVPDQVVALAPELLDTIDSFVGPRGLGFTIPRIPLLTDRLQWLGAYGDLAVSQVNDRATGRTRDQVVGSVTSASTDRLPKDAQDTGDRFDPRIHPAASQVYGLKVDDAPDLLAAREALVTLACIQGWTGPSCVSYGGFDYHDGTQATSDTMDFQAGQSIGRAVELAHRLGKPLFFQILTDGGVAAASGSRRWTSDAGDKGMTVIGYYDPRGPVAQRTLQIGQYTAGQGADQDAIFGKNTDAVARAVAVNYLSVAGQLGEIRNIFTEDQFPTEWINQALIFESSV